ncbi:superfamily II DNA/RNA helicase [Prosthecomicrobium pneumaticum]|uniref:DEAD-box ATP-dependent RNA helicase RhpA n=1 Tax=Prosthecomicrobium pneumaticum TaxID=81895 RepID=A0A7W9CT53_9HYPH|nr:superfamily II DNA/RNA helicase [Prosthecomicrobium pneumaticum]
MLAAVTTSGYTTPTPIQAGAIPHVLEGRDVLGIAQTGTGKTASFVLPMLTRLEQGRARARMPRTLILEPTRELAAQVEENFVRYGQNHKLSVALIIGGVSFGDQEKKLDRGVDVLIATPGRLIDLFERGKLMLTGVEILVIDEADRMLDMGFIPDIERICKMLPFTRQTLFFSATMPPEITRLADAFLTNPVRVEVARPATTAKTVAQHFITCGRESADKRATLRDLIRGAVDLKNAIIFCNRKRDVAVVARSLERHGFSVGALHGDMDQRARMATLDAFKNNRLTLLVASDVAARGLDIPDVSHVYNYDVPTHADDYVHRIGRTGRAGRSGTSVTLVTPAETKYVDAIKKLTGDNVSWLEPGVSTGSGDTAEDERPARGRGRRSDKSREARSSEGRSPEAKPSEAKARETKPRQEAERRRAPREAEPAGTAETAIPSSAPRSGPVTQGTASPSVQRPRNDAPQGDQRRGRGRRDDHDGPTPVGLGDHVPQFLLRPVRVPS